MSLDPTPSKAPRQLWREEDYLMAACAAMPLVAEGMTLEEALLQVNILFTPDKIRPPEGIRYAANSPLMHRVLETVQRLSPESRAEQVQRLHQLRALSGFKPHAPRVRWSDVEWAKVYRRVKYMQRDMSDSRSEQLLVFDAMQIELPPERWRKRASIVALTDPKDSGNVSYQLRRIADKADLLLAAEPAFEPGKKPQAPPPLDAADDALAAPQTALAAALAAAPPRVEAIPDPVPEPEPEPVALPRPRRTRQELPNPLLATTPPPMPQRPIPDAVRGFGEAFATHLAGMMDAICTKAAAEIVDLLQDRIRSTSESIVGHAVSELDRRMQGMLKATLEKHLGEGIEVINPEPQPELAGSGLPEGAKVDVVGLFGQQVVEVQRALNGYADAVRFIDLTEAHRWKPRSVVIINDKVSGKKIETRCREAGATTVHVYGSSSAVITAIKGVYERHGINIDLQH